MLAATLGIALATSVLFGLAPAIYASRVNVQGSLSDAGTRSVAGGAGRWSRRILVVAEVALGVVLLVSAGLLVRSFVHLRSLNPGFDPSQVTTAIVSLQDKRYEDAARVNQLFEESLARIRQHPGIEAAGIALGLPYTRLLNMGWRRIEGFDPNEKWLNSNVSYITPGYIEALRLPLRRGRAFSERDRDGPTPVAIVNEGFGKELLQGRRYRRHAHSRRRRGARNRRYRRQCACDLVRAGRRRWAPHRAVRRLRTRRPRSTPPSPPGAHVVFAGVGNPFVGPDRDRRRSDPAGGRRCRSAAADCEDRSRWPKCSRRHWRGSAS